MFLQHEKDIYLQHRAKFINMRANLAVLTLMVVGIVAEKL
jgi:hypothetical protein